MNADDDAPAATVGHSEGYRQGVVNPVQMVPAPIRVHLRPSAVRQQDLAAYAWFWDGCRQSL